MGAGANVLNPAKTRALSKLSGLRLDRVLCDEDGVNAYGRVLNIDGHSHYTIDRRDGSWIWNKLGGHWTTCP